MKQWYDIPGWFNFHDVYDRAVDTAPDGAHFVEVGSWKGRSSVYMARAIRNSGKRIKFDCVDTWKGSEEHAGMPGLEQLLEEFRVNTRGWGINAVVGESVTVAESYKDGSLDFVFLDAAHDEDSVYADIAAWKPKLKPDGVMAGDDVTEFPGVGAALKRHGHDEVMLGISSQPAWIIAPDGVRPKWMVAGGVLA